MVDSFCHGNTDFVCHNVSVSFCIEKCGTGSPLARGWVLKISFSKPEESLKVVRVESLAVLTSVVTD